MNAEIELRHLRYFLAVAEALHFSRAAERLGIAQPPLSQQIKRLEQLIGFPLFERTTRGVKLTPAGVLLEERARQTLGRWEEDLEQVRRLGLGQEGHITLSFSGSIMLSHLPEAIELYRRRFPAVELRLLELSTAAQQELLLKGEVDIGFLRDGDPHVGLTLENLLQEPFLAVLPVQHALAKARRVSVAKLAAEPFVLYSRNCGPLAFDRTMACCDAAGFRPRIVQETPQWPTVLRLVSAGLGVSLAPASVAGLQLPDVVFRPIDAPAMSWIDVAAKPGPMSPAAHQFLTVARRAFGRSRHS